MLKNIKSICILIILSIEGCTTHRVIVNNCTDIDTFGKYKICDLLKDQ